MTASRAVRPLTVLWPAFLMAGVAELLVFAVVDPLDLHWRSGAAVGLDRQAVYTVTFLLFWALISAAATITLWLAAPRR